MDGRLIRAARFDPTPNDCHLSVRARDNPEIASHAQKKQKVARHPAPAVVSLSRPMTRMRETGCALRYRNDAQ